MRKDIEIHIDTGDIVIQPQNKPNTYPFSWIENESGSVNYLYGEIQMPDHISERDIWNHGIFLTIPYTPVNKNFYIKIQIGSNQFVQNPIVGGSLFLVRAGLYGDAKTHITASELPLISGDIFYVKLDNEFADIYSGNKSDVNIVPAQHQNANLLLKCMPTNNYRYPVTGIGLTRWINGNINYAQLFNVLQKEFNNDGITMNDASFDLESHDLYLDLKQYGED
jgi:hypothetical protein